MINKKRNDSKVAIIVKTYLRDGFIQRLVHSINEHFPLSYKLYIGDEKPLSVSKNELYKKLENNGHYIEIFEEPKPFPVGVARNRLYARTNKEPYILRLDDDYIFTEETNINNMLLLLNYSRSAGAVSGFEKEQTTVNDNKHNINNYQQGYFYKKDTSIYKFSIPIDFWHWRYYKNVRFQVVDFTSNFLLIKKEVLEKQKWNEELLFRGEHTDFMLDLKKNGWLLMLTPDSIHVHDESGIDKKEEYKYEVSVDTKISKKIHDKILMNKWGIKNKKRINLKTNILDNKYFTTINKIKKKVHKIIRKIIRK